jgi:succinoglycan biosynthesis protein ExoA
MPENDLSVSCSVLMPVLNEATSIEAAVASISAQRLSGGLELLVIDGGSTDGTREILTRLARQDQRVRLLENPKGLISPALNIGLARARGRWIARMDAHSQFPPDYLARGITRLAAGDTTWVSGPQLPVGHNPVSRAVELALGSWLGSGPSRRWSGRQNGGEQELDSGVFCGVWERATLLSVGGWDERWRVNEDSEMAGRFFERGERLICLPEMVARYSPRGSLRRLWSQYRQYGQFRERTALRHPATLRRSHLIAPSLVALLLAAALPWQLICLPARAALAVYLLALLAVARDARRRGASRREAALVPLTLATMHLAHGCGFWLGAGRYGPPLAALLRVLGLGRLARRLAPAPVPVFAPELVLRTVST